MFIRLCGTLSTRPSANVIFTYDSGSISPLVFANRHSFYFGNLIVRICPRHRIPRAVRNVVFEHRYLDKEISKSDQKTAKKEHQQYTEKHSPPAEGTKDQRRKEKNEEKQI